DFEVSAIKQLTVLTSASDWAPPPAAGPAAETILVADDNPDVREYVRGALRDYYRVILASDGEDGLRKAREAIPDLIISDVMMPRLDGQDLCRAVKAEPRLAGVPVILLTARASEDMRI